MSYDINFWKQDRPLELNAGEIYGRLCSGEPVDGLAKLPVDEILARLQQQFPTFDPKAKFPDVQLDEGNIEFIWSDQHFRFDFRGDVPAADRNAIVAILRDFDCPLYDPQTNERHDAADGTAVGPTPPFEDLTPEQKVALEKMKAEMMAMFAGPRPKKGCAGPAALLLLSVGGLAWGVLVRLA